MKHGTCSLCTFLGRLAIGALFIWAGLGKIFNFDGVSAYMGGHQMTMVTPLLIGAIVLEILGGLFIVFGWKARITAAVLIIYLIVVSVIFHNFWALDGAARAAELSNLMHNVAIIGGLFYILGCGSGHWACDRCCCCPKTGDETACR